MTVGIAPNRARPRWLALLIACTVFTLLASSVALAFPPGPGTGNNDPFNPTDGVAACDPSPSPDLNSPTSGTATTDVTCTESGGPKAVTVHWISDTVSGTSTDNAWGQGDKSDCYKVKAGGDAAACVTQVYGIGASKTDLQYHGIGLEKGANGHDYLYSGIKRLNAGGVTSSNANYNVEVNQLLDAYKPANPICPLAAPTTGGCNIWRSPGDLTFMTDWGGNQSSCGVATPAICAYVWIDPSTGAGKTPNSGTCFNAKTAPCWGVLDGGSPKLSDNTDKAAGSINDGAATQPYTFSEIGVDLTASGLVQAGACETFKNVWAHSRSSSSFSAELKDFIFGNVSISTCTTTDTAIQQIDCVTDANIGSAAKTLTLNLAVGGSVCVKDKATVGGGATDGNVNFRYYSTLAACEADTAHTGGTDAGTNAVNGSGIASSDKVTFSSTGVRYFRAFYLGDGLSPSTSPCDEVITVRQNTSVATTLHETNSSGTDVTPSQNGLEITVVLGSYVKDYASVSPSSATGSIAFRYYPSLAACTADTAGSAGTAAGGGSVSSGTASSSVTQMTSVGDFYWRAFYTGTSPNNDSYSPCNEIVHVAKIDTTTSTQLHETNSSGTDVTPSQNGLEITVIRGAYVKDVASVTPSAATGSVAFRYYSSLAACNADTAGSAGTAAGGGSVSSGTASSTATQMNTVGDFFWRAFFTGSGAYNDSYSECNEIVHVVRVNTAISTSPWYYPNDSATLSTPNGGGTLAGTIQFKLFDSAAACGTNLAADVKYESALIAVNGAGPYTSSNTSYAVTTGTTVYWRVEFVSSNPAQYGRTSFCVESISATLTGDSPGSQGNAP